MTQLLVLKEHIQKFYQKYSLILNLLFRFCIGYLTFFAANQVIGYNPLLNHVYVELLLALFSIVMPVQAILLMAAVFTVVHVFYVSQILALVMSVIFIILYLLYVQFVPKHGYIIMAIPIVFALHIPYGVPVLMGLIATPVTILPVGCGVCVYYLIQTVTSVVAASTDDTIDLYQVVVNQLTENSEMYAAILIFAAVIVVVYIIRTRGIDYSFEIAILAGIFLETILFLITNYLLDININMLQFLGGTIISALLVWLIQFFRLSLNYAGVENLQFEDEEYYYYVRAVPKMSIAARSKSVKRFNAHHFSEQVTYLDEEEVKRVQEAITGQSEQEEDTLEQDFDFKVSLNEEDLKKDGQQTAE